MRVFATRHKRCQKCLTDYFACAIVFCLYTFLFCIISSSGCLTTQFTESSIDFPPRLVHRHFANSDTWEGNNAVLICLVEAQPLADFSWYRLSNGHREDALKSARVAIYKNILFLRDSKYTDSGLWLCEASNPLGKLIVEITLKVLTKLEAALEPTTHIAVTGSTASFKCKIKGEPTNPVQWFQNGEHLKLDKYFGRIHLQGDRNLIIGNVKESDIGVYQCSISNKEESAQAHSLLLLGDAPPQFRFTFSEQALRIGQQVTLKCTAFGDPIPVITWTLDGRPIPESLSQRYLLGHYVDKSGDVVGQLNITYLQAEDGGLYGCNATNTMGSVIHQARLDVYGSPYIRFISPLHAVAGSNITIVCPYSGYPISSVKWEKKGDLIEKPAIEYHQDTANYPGTFYINEVTVDHAGTYTCTVTGPTGGLARREMHFIVHKPPKLLPFFFPTNLEEGESVQATCSASSGDKPMFFSWFKDGAPLTPSLKIELRNVDFFSLLIIAKVTAAHNGIYTCRAFNNVADKNVTAELIVKVPPHWILEPQNISALASSSLVIPCSANGHPSPKVSWMKALDHFSDTFHPIAPNDDISEVNGISVLGDGSLWFPLVKSSQEGRYKCVIDNNVGKPLSKILYLSVNEPAQVTGSAGNVTTRHGGIVSMKCVATGDIPLTLNWLRGSHKLTVDARRIIVMETRTDSSLNSELTIKDANNEDSGLYKCQAENIYGRSETKMYLIVQERPKPPVGLHVAEVLSRNVHLSWRKGHDGGSPIIAYLVQYQPVVSPARELTTRQWTPGDIFNVTISHHQLLTERKGNENMEKAIIDGLRAATSYIFRMSAISEIYHSAFSDTINVRTQDEAPSEAPRNVQVDAIQPKELQVAWRIPPHSTWNGDLLGYTVYWKEEIKDSKDKLHQEKHIKVRGSKTSSYVITGLKNFCKYSVRVTAYNALGNGPASSLITAITQEGVPEAPPVNTSCVTLSSVSMRIWWLPPPANLIGGMLQGYKVHYLPLLATDDDSNPELEGEVKRAGGTETVLRALRRFTEYSIRVKAYTSSGDGVFSEAITCTTDEDVPGAPSGFKTASISSNSIVVGWLLPDSPNGVIIHHTVYIKELTRATKATSYQIPVNSTGESTSSSQPMAVNEHQYIIRGLADGNSYELWMSASTKMGEGSFTTALVQQPSSLSPAKILSFGGTLKPEYGSSTLLRCSVGGVPTPHTQWYKDSVPLRSGGKIFVTPRGHLLLSDIDASSAGSYVCTAHNVAGSDRLPIMLSPTRPSLPLRLTLLSAHANYLRISMPALLRHTANLHYRPIIPNRHWEKVEVQPGSTEYTIIGLKCATVYQMYATSHKTRIVATSELEKFTLTVRTAGGPPLAPKDSSFLTINDTVLMIDTSEWLVANEKAGDNCGQVKVFVESKARNEPDWNFAPAVIAPSPIFLSNLTPATWYRLKFTITNDAGVTVSYVNFATTTETGSLIDPPPDLETYFDDNYTDSLSIMIMCAAVTLILATLVITLLKIRSHRCKCSEGLCGWSDPGVEVTPQKEEAPTIPRVAFHPLTGKRSMVDMYEISPYATFNGAAEPEDCGSPISSNFDYALNLRTFSCDGDDDTENVHQQPVSRQKQTRRGDRNDRSRRSSKGSTRMHQRFCQQYNDEIQPCPVDSDRIVNHHDIKNYEKIHRDRHFEIDSDFLQRHAMTLQMAGPPR